VRGDERGGRGEKVGGKERQKGGGKRRVGDCGIVVPYHIISSNLILHLFSAFLLPLPPPLSFFFPSPRAVMCRDVQQQHFLVVETLSSVTKERDSSLDALSELRQKVELLTTDKTYLKRLGDGAQDRVGRLEEELQRCKDKVGRERDGK
jgi:hypothetical protein